MQFLQPLWWTLHGKTNLAIIIQARHLIQRIVFVKNVVEKTRSVGRVVFDVCTLLTRHFRAHWGK